MKPRDAKFLSPEQDAQIAKAVRLLNEALSDAPSREERVKSILKAHATVCDLLQDVLLDKTSAEAYRDELDRVLF